MSQIRLRVINDMAIRSIEITPLIDDGWHAIRSGEYVLISAEDCDKVLAALKAAERILRGPQASSHDYNLVCDALSKVHP